MKTFFFKAVLLLLLPFFSPAQKITYSAPIGEDNRDMDFDIIGKLQGNILVYKNVGNSYRISVYNNNMQFKERVSLGFLPNKTFNVDFVAYPDFFYIVFR